MRRRRSCWSGSGLEVRRECCCGHRFSRLQGGDQKHVTLHSFRHQFATRALEAGVSSFHLQAIGGWKSPIMLQRYGKVRNKALHEQMAKLNGPTLPQAEAEVST